MPVDPTFKRFAEDVCVELSKRGLTAAIEEVKALDPWLHIAIGSSQYNLIRSEEDTAEKVASEIEREYRSKHEANEIHS